MSGNGGVAMAKTLHQRMHEQHTKWQIEHDAWMADIDRWKRDLQQALSDLKEVEEMLYDSLDALEFHARRLWENQQRVRAHEAILAEEARHDARKTDKEREAIHAEHAAQHERTMHAHERIRKHHNDVVAQIVRLLAQAGKAM